MAELTGKERFRLCYLPAASAERDAGIIRWYEHCAPLDLHPMVQASSAATEWKTAGRTSCLLWAGSAGDLESTGDRRGTEGASAGSLCWFEEGITDSLLQELTKIECLGFLRGSHSPHYDAEGVRRPTYHQMIRSGELKPGYVCDNDTGIYLEDNEVRRIVKTRQEAKVYQVSLEVDQIVETELPAEMID